MPPAVDEACTLQPSDEINSRPSVTPYDRPCSWLDTDNDAGF
jgi:hypothetical protein